MKPLLFLFLIISPFLSQPREPQSFYINKFGWEQGLASNQIFTITQDSKGFLWIGSMNGLQRFDGRNFMTYRIKSPDLQPTQPVKEILIDLAGKIWLRVGEEYGLYEPEKELFTPIPFEKLETRYLGEQFWMDSLGRLFILINNTKLLWIDPDSQMITDQNIPIQLPENWRPRTIFEDSSGRYWIGCVEGIAVFDPGKNQIYTPAFNPEKLPLLDRENLRNVTFLNQDSHGIFWLNYWDPDEYTVSFDPVNNHWRDHKPEFFGGNANYQEVFGSIEFADGGFWRYGIQTLSVFDRSNFRFKNIQQQDLQFDKISKIIADPTGGAWLGTDQGLYFINLDNSQVEIVNLAKGSGNFEFQAIEEVIYNGDTSIWLGSWGNGIQTLDLNLQEINPSLSFSNSPGTVASRQVWDIHFDTFRNWVWIGLQQGILQIFDLEKGTSQWIQPQAFQKSTIRSISQLENGDMCFGTQSGRVIRFQGDLISEARFEQILKLETRIPKIITGKDQTVWIGTTDQGVLQIDPESGKILTHLLSPVLSSNQIERIIQVDANTFLMGFELLNQYNTNTGENQFFSYSEGMLSNHIYDMKIDKESFVWIYTALGISRYDPSSQTFSNFGKNHILSNLPDDGRTGIELSSGKLLFVSNNHLIQFDPLNFERNLPPTKPSITNVELFGTYVGDEYSLEPKQQFESHENSLSFQFNIINFALQDRFGYQFRLVGLDPTWKETSQDFKAVFSLLPPGEYQFEVRSYNEAGFFSSPAVYPFQIKPSFVQTWWFKGGLALLFLAIILVIYKLHVNRILAVANLRSKLARDLHDDMGSTLSTINILSSMAHSKFESDPVKSKNFISKISENSQRMLESMDDIIWSIKPQNDSIERLISRMREFANQTLEGKEIGYQFLVDPKVNGMKLSMDARRNLFLIFKEGINNAAKYSKAKQVEISFGIEQGSFWMRIKDNGCGFDTESVINGNGLENMKKRAAAVQGSLQIRSKKDKGTSLLLTLNI